MNTNLLKRLTQLGLHTPIDELEAKRVRLLNYIAVITITFQLFFIPLSLMNDLPLFVNIYFIILSGTILILQSKQQFHISRWLFLSCSSVMYSMMNKAFGLYIGANYGFICFCVIAMFLFETKNIRFLAIAIISIIYFGLPFLSDFKFLPQGKVDIYSYYASFIVLTVFTLFVVNFYIELVNKYAKKTNHLIKKVKSKNAELERFSYIASHDLKTPLRSINGFSKLALKASKPYQNKSLNEYLEYIKDNAKQMNIFIQGILRYNRVDNNMGLQIDDIDIAQMLGSIKKTLSTYKGKPCEISIDKVQVPKIKMNVTHAYSIFNNLIGNGLKYNQSDKPAVTLETKYVKDKVIFYCSDNGIGIPNDQKEAIFEMFSRAHQKHKGYEGTGLGLAITKKIIESYNGNILVDNSCKEGSTFKITFPKTMIDNQ